MGGSKNKSPAQKEKSQSKNKDAKKDKKKGQETKHEIKITINEDEAVKIIKNSKMITVFELAKQTNVKISTANNYLIKLLEKGLLKDLVVLVVTMYINQFQNRVIFPHQFLI